MRRSTGAPAGEFSSWSWTATARPALPCARYVKFSNHKGHKGHEGFFNKKINVPVFLCVLRVLRTPNKMTGPVALRQAQGERSRRRGSGQAVRGVAGVT